MTSIHGLICMSNYSLSSRGPRDVGLGDKRTIPAWQSALLAVAGPLKLLRFNLWFIRLTLLQLVQR